MTEQDSELHWIDDELVKISKTDNPNIVLVERATGEVQKIRIQRSSPTKGKLPPGVSNPFEENQ